MRCSRTLALMNDIRINSFKQRLAVIQGKILTSVCLSACAIFWMDMPRLSCRGDIAHIACDRWYVRLISPAA